MSDEREAQHDGYLEWDAHPGNLWSPDASARKHSHLFHVASELKAFFPPRYHSRRPMDDLELQGPEESEGVDSDPLSQDLTISSSQS